MAAILRMGTTVEYMRYLRHVERAHWIHQCDALPQHPDESGIQVRVKLVSKSPVTYSEVQNWSILDHSLTAGFKRVDNMVFGGRVRSFTVIDGYLYIDVQLLNISCEYAPGTGALEKSQMPLWLMLKSRRLELTKAIPMMKIAQRTAFT